MSDGWREVTVTFQLSAEDQIVIERYLSEVNELIRSGDRILTRQKPEGIRTAVAMTGLWTDQDAICALLATAIERERGIQKWIEMRRDGIANLPPWLRTLVNESLETPTR